MYFVLFLAIIKDFKAWEGLIIDLSVFLWKIYNLKSGVLTRMNLKSRGFSFFFLIDIFFVAYIVVFDWVSKLITSIPRRQTLKKDFDESVCRLYRDNSYLQSRIVAQSCSELERICKGQFYVEKFVLV